MQSSGVVSKTVPGRRVFFIQDEQTGEEVFAHAEQTDLCQVNAHFCMYQPGTPVTFNLLSNRHGLYASQIRLDQNKLSIELPQVEESTLMEWRHRYGFLRREPCQCSLFIGEADWKTRIDEYGALGRRVRHGIASRDAKCFAVQAELLSLA